MLHSKHPTSTLKKKWNTIVANGEQENEGGIVQFTARGLGINENIFHQTSPDLNKAGRCAENLVR
jgi:hypothetical protein